MNFIKICFVSLLLLVMAGCGIVETFLGDDNDNTNRNNVKVGVLAPITNSSNETDGVDAGVTIREVEKHINYWLDNTNSDLDKIEFVIKDSGADSATALIALQAFYDQGIRIVIGPYFSSVASEVTSFADEKGMLLISPSSTASSLNQDDNLIRFVAPDSYLAGVLKELMKREEKEAVLTIYQNDTYGTSFASDLASVIAADTGFNPDSTATVSFGDTTAELTVAITAAETELQSLIDTYGAENVSVAFIAFEQNGINFINGISSSSVLKNVQWYIDTELCNNSAIPSNTNLSTFADAVNLTGVSIAAGRDETHVYAKVIESYVRDTVGYDPVPFVVNSWDAAWLIAYVLEGMFTASEDITDVNVVKTNLIELSSIYFGGGGISPIDSNTGDLQRSNFSLYNFDNGSWSYFGSYTSDAYSSEQLKLIVDTYTADITENVSFKLGALVSYSISTWENSVGAMELAVEQVNSYFQSRGESVVVSIDVLETHTTDDVVNDAVGLYNQLVVSGAKAVVGPPDSTQVEAITPFVGEDSVLISPSSSAAQLAIEDNVFRLISNDDHQAKALSNIIRTHTADTLLILHVDDIYGAGLRDSVTSVFEVDDTVAGHTAGTVYSTISYNPYAGSFDDVLTSLNTAVGSAIVDVGLTSKVSVLLVGYEEIEYLMANIGAYSNLMSVRWYGTDSVTLYDGVISNPDAYLNASSVYFTAPAYDQSALGLLMPQLFSLEYELGASNLTGYELNCYDAVWLSSLAYLNQLKDTNPFTITGTEYVIYDGTTNAEGLSLDEYLTLDAENTTASYVETLLPGTDYSMRQITEHKKLSNYVTDIAGDIYGVTNKLSLESSGDRAIATYTFYRVSDNAWNAMATYQNSGLNPGINMLN